MFGSEKKDLEESIKLINSAIKKEQVFKKYSDKQVLEHIIKESKDITHFISTYLTQDSLYIHYHKKSLLLDIIRELNHLISSCKYYYNYSVFDQNKLLEIISQINSLFNKYSEYGSLYVFRHCEKVKRTDAKGMVYDGIPTHAIRSEAMKRAKEIIDEILISPKNVRVIFYHSEERRTKIFAEIIEREIIHHLRHCKDKIEIINKGYDSGIRFSYFTKDSLNESMPTYKQKGEFYSFSSWYFNTNEFKSFRFQPRPHDVIAGVDGFVKSHYRSTVGGDRYTIVIAITHSWVIDAYLLHKIPGLENQVKNVINTAGFFKVECGEINYLGKWVNL